MAAPIRAYLLIETETGKSNSVLDRLNELDQTIQADRVTGPYDVICILETDDLGDVDSIVREMIHTMEGVERTMSCLRLGS